MTSKWGGRPAARFRRLILERDGYRCRMLRDRRPCGDPATTVQHVVPLHQGGAAYDPANAIAACAPCNQREGGRYRQPPRPAPPALTANQTELADLADRLGVPFDSGQHHAGRRLAASGVRPRSADLAAVTAWRRARGPREPAIAPRPW